MPDNTYSIKLRFESEEGAANWFRQVRDLHLVPDSLGLRMQELSEVEAPAQDTRLIASPEPAERHAWIVEPEVVRDGR